MWCCWLNGPRPWVCSVPVAGQERGSSGTTAPRDTEPRQELVSPSNVFVGFFFLSWSLGCTSSSSPHLLQVTTGATTFNQGLAQDKSWWGAAVGACGSNRIQPTVHPDGALNCDPLLSPTLFFCVLACELLFNTLLKQGAKTEPIPPEQCQKLVSSDEYLFVCLFVFYIMWITRCVLLTWLMRGTGMHH